MPATLDLFKFVLQRLEYFGAKPTEARTVPILFPIVAHCYMLGLNPDLDALFALCSVTLPPFMLQFYLCQNLDHEGFTCDFKYHLWDDDPCLFDQRG